jgi:hypothetical protein
MNGRTPNLLPETEKNPAIGLTLSILRFRVAQQENQDHRHDSKNITSSRVFGVFGIPLLRTGVGRKDVQNHRTRFRHRRPRIEG